MKNELDQDNSLNPPEKGNKNSNGGPDFWKYLNIVLLAVLIIIGANRFILPMIGGGNSNLSQVGLEYYAENYGEELGTDGVESKVQNLGCHSEIHIYKDGTLVMRLSYFNGKVYEL